jgi:hypothetical protein
MPDDFTHEGDSAVTQWVKLQALIKYFSSWQQASQTKNFLPIFFIKFNMNFGCNSITASYILPY